MKIKIVPVFMMSMIVLGMSVLTGCQTIRDSRAQSTEQMLSAAGFRMKLAQTPAQLANIQAMPQRQLVPQVQSGRDMYVYADAEFCQCVYVGTESNNQQYQNMNDRQDWIDDRQNTAEIVDREDDNFGLPGPAFDYDAWGPWGPWD